MPRFGPLAGMLVLVAVLVVGGFLAVDRLGGEAETEAVIDKPELGTANVVQTDLVEHETFPAVLRFADPGLVTATLGGTVTAIPDAGSSLHLFDSVVEIDGQPILLFPGDRPMWRLLALPLDGSELSGADVQQLEENLLVLGYPTLREEEEELPAIGPADDVFDEDTVRLIEDWRADIGLDEGGYVEAGRIMYAGEGFRIARTLTTVGAFVAPGTPLFETSATEQEIFLQLPVDKRDLVEIGTPVSVTLPDDAVAGATVTGIGSVVTYVDEEAPGLIEVNIRLDDPSLGSEFDESPVDVEIVSNEERGVLAVPVNALLALAEGGYALEVQRGEAVVLIAVDTGLFVDGLVEVTGEVVAGDTIIVPK